MIDAEFGRRSFAGLVLGGDRRDGIYRAFLRPLLESKTRRRFYDLSSKMRVAFDGKTRRRFDERVSYTGLATNVQGLARLFRDFDAKSRESGKCGDEFI